MKKYGLILILILSMLLQVMPSFAITEDNIEEITQEIKHRYSVSGYAESGNEGLPVTINVFCPGKSADDLGTFQPNEVLVYHKQDFTGADGFFKFEFDTTERGEYIADVRVSDEENVRSIKAIAKYTGTPVFSMDFEEIPSDLFIQGSVANTFTDDEHGKSLALTPGTQNVSIGRTVDEYINNGAYLIEYDTMLTRTDNFSYFRIVMDENNIHSWTTSEGMVFNNEGVLGYFSNVKGWTQVEYKKYEPNLWYNIKMWLDFDSGRVSYYVDDTFVAELYMPREMLNGIRTVGFISERNTGGVQYIDNWSIRKFDYSLLCVLNENTVPERLLNSMQISASDKVTGNIYFENKGTFYWNLENISAKAENVNVTYELNRTDGENVMTKTAQFDIKALKKKEIRVPIEFDKFGLYKMKITVSNENVYAQKELDLSYVHAADNLTGMGVCTHFGQNSGSVFECMTLLEKSGIGYIRDECFWTDYEKKKGVYEIPEKYANMIDEANSRGIEVIQLLTYGNNLYGSGAPWENDAMLAGFEEYCYNLALDLKGKVKFFEVWNEYSLNNEEAGVDGYIKLLKAGYNGVKRANPEAIVIAISPLDVGTDWATTVMKALNGERYMDVFACHPYNEFIPESSAYKWGYKSRFNIINTVQKIYGYEDIPIWATEVGWSSSTFENPAEYMVRISLLNEAHNKFGNMMDKMFFYDFQNDGVVPENSEHNYGMIKTWNGVDVPYAAKEAYLGVSNYNAILGGAECISYDEAANGNYTYKFQKGGQEIYALWNINGTENEILVSVPDGGAVLYDFYGNPEYIVPENGTVTVKVDKSPVYLKVGVEPEISVEYNGKTFETLEDVLDEGIISVHCENVPGDAELYAAFYENGSLKAIEKMSGSGNISLNIVKKAGYDSLKAFLWHDLTPIIENKMIGETL